MFVYLAKPTIGKDSGPYQMALTPAPVPKFKLTSGS